MAELREECNDGEISSIRIIQFDFSIQFTKIAQVVSSAYIFANSGKDRARLRRVILDKLDMKKALVWTRVLSVQTGVIWSKYRIAKFKLSPLKN